MRGYGAQIRKMEDSNGAVAAALMQLAKDYGNRHEIEPEVMKEAVRLVQQKFGWLGVDEIREAYRQHAAGEIKTKAGEMYGGEFNARQVGAILEAYNEKRKKIVADYINERTAQIEKVKAERKRAKQKEEFEANLMNSLRAARAKQLPVSSVPEFWHDSLLSRGVLNYTKQEKKDAWEDAACIMKQHKVSKVQKAIMGEDEQARRIAWAKKILVYRKLIIQ